MDMLMLPDNWKECSSQWLARWLVQKAMPRRRDAIARCLIFAAFDLGFLAKWSYTAPHLTLKEQPRFTWRIGDFTYRYLRRIDDDVAYALTESPVSPHTYLLTPPNARSLLHDALGYRLKEHAPMVMAVEDFVSLRAFFSATDAGWSLQQSTRQLIEAYNQRVVQLKCGGTGSCSITIQV
jgi:hypothetical protein